METYLVTLKNITYNDKFIKFLHCHRIKYKYLDDLQIYVIVTNIHCAEEINKFYYIDIIANEKDAKIESINNYPGDEVADDERGTIPQKNFYNWGVTKIKASYYWDRGFTGQGVNVAILDGGIHDHEYLKIAGRVYMGDITYPYNEHGVGMASIIGAQLECPRMTGVAYGCNIYDVNVANKNENLNSSNIIEGIEWCIDNNIHIMNLSFSFYGTPDLKKLFETTLEKASDHGIIIIAATGNSNEDKLVSPAILPPAYGIGATDRYNKRWNESDNLGSNYGPGIKFVAPGVDLLCMNKNSYYVQSGTSLAVPHVVGLIALILSESPQLSKEEINEILIGNSLKLPNNTTSYNLQYGFGLVQATKS